MTVMNYRTRDGLADYGFSIDYEPSIGWRVYIVFQPYHQGDDDGLPIPYQSIDDRGRRYVDWPTKIDSLGDAKTIASLWAEVAQRYQLAREQTALYVELIERHQRIRAQSGNTTAVPDRRGDAVDGGGAGPEHRNRGPIPFPKSTAQSLGDVQEREPNTHAVGSAASAMTTSAGGLTATGPARSATRRAVRGRNADRRIVRSRNAPRQASPRTPTDREEIGSELSVSIYLEDGQAPTVRDVRAALQSITDELGFELIPESDAVYGSFWQRFRAKASDPHVQEELYDRLIKLERSAEVRLLAVPESQANMQNAQGIAAIIESLKGEPAAVVQLGPLVVVKAPARNLDGVILCRMLTAKELRMLESRPGLLTDPCELMAQLNGSGEAKQVEQAQ
jgi:hypothetical protein